MAARQGTSFADALRASAERFGSQISAQAGISPPGRLAPQFESDLTRESYVDKKQLRVFQVSKLLETPVAAS